MQIMLAIQTFAVTIARVIEYESGVTQGTLWHYHIMHVRKATLPRRSRPKDNVELSDGIGERWRCGIGEREGLSDVEMVIDGIGEWWS